MPRNNARKETKIASLLALKILSYFTLLLGIPVIYHKLIHLQFRFIPTLSTLRKHPRPIAVNIYHIHLPAGVIQASHALVLRDQAPTLSPRLSVLNRRYAAMAKVEANYSAAKYPAKHHKSYSHTTANLVLVETNHGLPCTLFHL